MDWCYAVGDERKGPVGDEEFKTLVAERVVTLQTLVWNSTLTDWTPYGSTVGSAVPAQGVAGAVTGGVACVHCKGLFPTGELVDLSGNLYCANCKPIGLQRIREGLTATSEAEEQRNLYLKHEASVKSVGMLYLFGGTLIMILMGLVFPILFFVGNGPQFQRLGWPEVFGFMILAGFGVFQFVTGRALRRFRPWSRIVAGILSGLGLLGFPLGTIINGYILYLLFSQKGKMVFSEEYQRVIQQTPHIKYRTSLFVWICLGLVVALVLSGIGAVVLARK